MSDSVPKMCVRFTEHNEHEGETWNFYIDVEENEEAIDRLRSVFGKLQVDEEFELYDDIPLKEVKILVKHSRSGYMKFENHLDGKLLLPDDFEEFNENDFTRYFYKGGIRQCMEKLK